MAQCAICQKALVAGGLQLFLPAGGITVSKRVAPITGSR